jgi:tetratricopeptide (TPR) repeat protein
MGRASGFFLACLLPWLPSTSLAQNLAAAEVDLQQGRVHAALAGATDALAANPKDPAAQFLICRARYQLGQWQDAVNACRLAVTFDATQAHYHLWLGRSLGEQAQRAQLLAAYSLAKQVRGEFETAAKLAPQDSAVLSDLGEFYVKAPSLLGGGTDKARAIAARLGTVDPGQSHWLQSEIAGAKKNYDLAERELMLAIETSSNLAQAWMNLASFYQGRKRLDDMESAVRHGAAADLRSTSALVDGASPLIATSRNTPLAADLLQRYVNGGHLSEDAPAFIAHIKLAQLLDKLGDTAGAARQRAAARALAPEYVEPAPQAH